MCLYILEVFEMMIRNLNYKSLGQDLAYFSTKEGEWADNSGIKTFYLLSHLSTKRIKTG